MEVLKTIGLVILIMLCISAIGVKFMLQRGMHVPTNQELINGTKAVIEAKKNPPPVKEEKGPVKASEIKRLKKQ